MTNQRPLRICMITTFYPPYNFGGDGIFVQRLSKELAKQGHHVEVIHCQDAYLTLADTKPTKPYENTPGVIVHGLKSPFGFLSPLATQQFGFPAFKSAQIREILAKGFDVIHYHNISLVGGPKILEYGNAVKLYSMHEFWLVCPTHVMFKYQQAACTKKNCLTCQLSYKRPPQWWRYSDLVKKSVKNVDIFISPDRHTIKKHKELGLDLPVVHMPHFVPAAESEPIAPVASENGGSDTKPYFLFVGRLEKIKGLHLLIPVFKNYNRAKLLIAGTGDYGAHLKKLAGDSENIRFLGFQTGAHLDELFRNAQAVLVPSINYEVAPPLVILEAFIHGTPAIVRNFGSMPEIIEESNGGLLYNSENELPAEMDRLLDNPAYQRELGQNGYNAYLTQWTTASYLEKYLAMIREIQVAKGAASTSIQNRVKSIVET